MGNYDVIGTTASGPSSDWSTCPILRRLPSPTLSECLAESQALTPNHAVFGALSMTRTVIAFNGFIGDCVLHECPASDVTDSFLRLRSRYVLYQRFDNKRNVNHSLCDTPEYCSNSVRCDIDLSRKCVERSETDTSMECVVCSCLPGYAGFNCQRETNEVCAKHPCLNNGVCKRVGSSYHCDCKSGFEGVNCELKKGTRVKLDFYKYTAEINVSLTTYKDVKDIQIDLKKKYKFKIGNRHNTPHYRIQKTIFKIRKILRFEYVLKMIYKTRILFDYGYASKKFNVLVEAILTDPIITKNFVITSEHILYKYDGTLYKHGFEKKSRKVKVIPLQAVDWTIGSGRSSRGDTGPRWAAKGKYYTFADSSNLTIGRVIRLRLPPISLNSHGFIMSPVMRPQSVCLTFAYYIHGHRTGYLEVTEATNPSRVLFSEGEYDKKRWQTARVSIRHLWADTVDISLLAKVGGASVSDIAVDDIKVTPDMRNCSLSKLYRRFKLPRSCIIETITDDTTDECLNAYWAEFCRVSAPGVNPLIRERRPGTTPNAILRIARTQSMLAYNGNEESISNCYHDKYLKLDDKFIQNRPFFTSGMGAVTLLNRNSQKFICSSKKDNFMATLACRSIYIKDVNGRNTYKYTKGTLLKGVQVRKTLKRHKIVITEMYCKGKERNLLQCPHYYRYQSGVSCLPPFGLLFVNCSGTTESQYDIKYKGESVETNLLSDASQYECSFDGGTWCDMTHVGGSLRYNLTDTITATLYTGPRVVTSHYIYLETSGRTIKQDMYASIRTGDIEVTAAVSQCLTFKYSMHGLNIGRLMVYLVPVRVPVVAPVSGRVELPAVFLWTRIDATEDHDWVTDRIKMDVKRDYFPPGKDGINNTTENVKEYFYVKFDASVGDGYEGDIALDSIRVAPCGAITTTTDTTTDTISTAITTTIGTTTDTISTAITTTIGTTTDTISTTISTTIDITSTTNRTTIDITSPIHSTNTTTSTTSDITTTDITTSTTNNTSPTSDTTTTVTPNTTDPSTSNTTDGNTTTDITTSITNSTTPSTTSTTRITDTTTSITIYNISTTNNMSTTTDSTTIDITNTTNDTSKPSDSTITDTTSTTNPSTSTTNPSTSTTNPSTSTTTVNTTSADITTSTTTSTTDITINTTTSSTSTSTSTTTMSTIDTTPTPPIDVKVGPYELYFSCSLKNKNYNLIHILNHKELKSYFMKIKLNLIESKITGWIEFSKKRKVRLSFYFTDIISHDSLYKYFSNYLKKKSYLFLRKNINHIKSDVKLFYCGFTNSFCGLNTNSVIDDYDWSLNDGGKEEKEEEEEDNRSGPMQPWQGGYAYVNSSTYMFGDKASLILPSFNNYEGEACITFTYFLYGKGIGNLELYSKQRSGVQVLFSEGGYSYDAWQTFYTKVNITRDMRVIFRVKIGERHLSDIALDEVVIYVDPDKCSDVRTCENENVMNASPRCTNLIWNTYCNIDLNRASNPIYKYISGTSLNGFRRYMESQFITKAYFGNAYYYKLCFGHKIMVRLSGNLANRGRVKVRIPGHSTGGSRWGTVCRSNTDQLNAAVVCRQLGFSEYNVVVVKAVFSTSGRDSTRGRVYMTGLTCTGKETNIWSCPRDLHANDICSHDDDLVVICKPLAIPGRNVIMGSTKGDFNTFDAVTDTIFIPSITYTIPRPATVTGWKAYFLFASKVYLLIIRNMKGSQYGKEHYKIIGKTEASGSKKQYLDIVLLGSARIETLPGDLLALYFPVLNGIPYRTLICQSDQHKLRYREQPGQILVNSTYEFKIAPLFKQPCREYAFEVVLLPEKVKVDISIPVLNDLIYYCGFANDNCLSKVINIPNKASDEEIYWQRGNSINLQLANGPEDQFNNNNIYNYIIINANTQMTISRLEIPEFNRTAHGCIKFDYNFLGSDLDIFSLLVNNATVWSVTESAHRWRHIGVNVNFAGAINVTFRVLVMSTQKVIVAVDEIYIFSRPCIVKKISDFKRKEKRVNQKIIYISNINGIDTEVCGSHKLKCKSIGFAMSLSGNTKKIILSDTSNYIINGNEFNKTKFVTITANEYVNNTIFLEVKGNCTLLSLEVHNLNIKGKLLIESRDHTDLEITLNASTFKHFALTTKGSSALRVILSNSKFHDSVLNFESLSSTNGLVKNCVFTRAESQPGGNTTMLAALNFRAVTKGTHFYDIIDSEFSSYRTPTGSRFDHLVPHASLTFYIVDRWVTFNMNVRRCSFHDNERAVDISMRGDGKVLIEECLFRNNYGVGSGGAVRMTMTKNTASISDDHLRTCFVTITRSTFLNNRAKSTELYGKDSVYFQTRSPGDGGALYIDVQMRSIFNIDGLVNITGCTFQGNTTPIRGGSIFLGTDINCALHLCTITQPDYQHVHAKTGEIIYSSGNTTMSHVSMTAGTGLSFASISLFSYKASSPKVHRLIVFNTSLTCPYTYYVDILNSTTYGDVDSLETLSIYCKACADEHYSLKQSRVDIELSRAIRLTNIDCYKCPYGAKCSRGIVNNMGFWGAAYFSDSVVMYNCPKDYCASSTNGSIIYDKCANDRTGVLCGRCRDGFSESLYTTKCVPNDQCGFLRHWKSVAIMLIYGLLYVLFFMFETDYEGVVDSLVNKLRRFKSSPSPNEKEEDEDNVLLSESGYLQIFMYYVQTCDLLAIDIVVQPEPRYDYVARPSEIGDGVVGQVADVVSAIFDFDALSMGANACILTNVGPVTKTILNVTFIAYFFFVLLVIYSLSWAGRCFTRARRSPRIGSIRLDDRILITCFLLLLYTYQELAESSLKLLNCSIVNGRSVLYYNGNVLCGQPWQYVVAAVVGVFIVPFFVVLLFGPRLLQKRRIGVAFFMLSFLFPMFTAIPIVYLFVREYNKDKAVISEGSNVTVPVETVKGSNKIVSLLVDIIFGPYGGTLLGGLCWEGFMNLRRLVLIVVYTFVADALTKHVLLVVICFLILLIHLKIGPFKHRFSNLAEAFSLSLLSLVSVTNLVKAAFYNAQRSPRQLGLVVVALFEWLELLAVVVLPVGIAALIAAAMVFRGGRGLIVEKRRASGGGGKILSPPPQSPPTNRQAYRNDDLVFADRVARYQERIIWRRRRDHAVEAKLCMPHYVSDGTADVKLLVRRNAKRRRRSKPRDYSVV